MKQYVRCKVCGHIIEVEKAGSVCPACGVLKSAFEPYKMNLSEKRKRFLDLHIHPILLHFPQAFTIFALILMILIPFLNGSFKDTITSTARVILTLLPLTVIAGFLSGIMDGKVRFRKVTTPILKIKIILGSAYILFSLACAVIVQLMDFSNAAIAMEIALLVFSSACSAFLGKLGGSLMESKMPG